MSASSLSRRESDRYMHKTDNDLRRLPVGKENAATKSEWYESVDKLDFPATVFQKTCGATAGRLTEMEPSKKFDEMVNTVQQKRREFQRGTEDFPDMDVWDREKGTMILTPRCKFNKKEKKWMRNDHRLLEQKLQTSEGKEKDADVKAAKSARRTGSATGGGNSEKVGPGLRKEAHVSPMNTGSYSRAALGEDSAFLDQNLQKPSYQWQKLKETKLKEVKRKAELHRKSLYVSRGLSRLRTKQNSIASVFSPRASSRTEKCRVKAIEELKKAKLKTREHKERAASTMRKESFAVVKCSYDPPKDFRDSMVEMIAENSMNQPEELKELLVCYLTLNSEVYHEMIIKVFREVWIDLKRHSYNTEVQNLNNLSF